MPDGRTELEWTLKTSQVEDKLKAVDALQEKYNKSVENSSRRVNHWEQQLKKTERAAASNAWEVQLKKTAAAAEAVAQRQIELDRKVSQERINAFVNAQRAVTKGDPWKMGLSGLEQAAQPKVDYFRQAQEKTLAAQRAQDDARRAVDAKAVESVTAAHTTPLENYKKNVAELIRLKREAGLSQEAFNRALAAEKKEFQDSIGLTQRRAKAQRDAAAETKRSADEARRFGEETRKLVATPVERYKARMGELSNALKTGTIDQETFNRAAGMAKRELDEAGKSGESLFGAGALSNVTALAGGMFSLAGAIGIVTQGYEEQLRVKEELKNFNLELAGSQADATLNFAGLPTETKQKLFAETIPALQKEIGFGDQNQLIKALGTAYAASGDIEQATKSVRAAAQLSRNTPEQLDVFAGAANDIMRATGETSAENALGFLLQTNARVVDPRKLAENLPPAMQAAANSAKGDDDKEAGKLASAVFSVLSREGTDTQGDRTRTASMHLFGELREFFESGENGRDPGSPQARIKTLQGNAQLRQAFLDSYKGEQQFKPGIENLLTPGTIAAREVWENMNKLRFDRAEFDQLEKEVTGASPQLKLGAAQGRIKANEQAYKTSQNGVIEALQKQGFDAAFEALDKTNLNLNDYLQATIDRRVSAPGNYLFGKSDLDTAEFVLGNRLHDRESGLRGATERGDAAAIKLMQDHVELLRSQMEELKAMRKELESIKQSNQTMANEPKPRAAAPRSTTERR